MIVSMTFLYWNVIQMLSCFYWVRLLLQASLLHLYHDINFTLYSIYHQIAKPNCYIFNWRCLPVTSPCNISLELRIFPAFFSFILQRLQNNWLTTWPVCILTRDIPQDCRWVCYYFNSPADISCNLAFVCSYCSLFLLFVRKKHP